MALTCSPRMLGQARQHLASRPLHGEEVLHFLETTDDHGSLIVATDVFVYIADLRPDVLAVRRRTASNGAFAFSTPENSSDASELLPETRRYRRAQCACKVALIRPGFTRIDCRPTVLRKESGSPVNGWTIVAQKTSRADPA